VRKFATGCITALLAAIAFTASALPGTFAIDEIYSNADGTVQFIEIFDSGRTDCDAGEAFWSGLALTSSGPGPQKTYVFPANLTTCKTSGRRILIASEGFAALGLVAPDFVIPNHFLQVPAGAVDFAGLSELTYAALPTDGVRAIDGNGNPIQNVATNLAGASASVVPTAPPTTVNIDQQGLTGSWYQAATSGQGIEVEVFEDLAGAGVGYLQGSWFTFDAAASGGADHGRWYTFGGNVSAGTNAATLPLYRNVGGNFDAPPVTAAAQVGTITLTFADCASAQFAYTFTDGTNRSGTIPLTRLTPNVLCATAGSLPGPSDFGLSGNWFDPAKGGQGFVFEINPAARVVFLTWYTYAANGQSIGAEGQRWYTAQAAYTPGTRTMPVLLYETTGGLLDRASPAPATAQVGTATLTFASCNSATMTYAFTAGSNAGRAGAMNLVRVGSVPASCTF
jgi:hypothetical protein